MKKDAVTIQMDSEKLRAVKRYMEKKDADLEQELGDALQKLYEKHVPAAVRDTLTRGMRMRLPLRRPLKNRKKKIGLSRQLPHSRIQFDPGMSPEH